MIPHSTMIREEYPRAWSYLFSPALMQAWASDAAGIPHRVRTAMRTYGGLTPADLAVALTPGIGPTLRVMRGSDSRRPWMITTDEIAISYRYLMSYQREVMFENVFRDQLMTSAIVGWNAIQALKIKPEMAAAQAEKFIFPAYGLGFAPSQLMGKELDDVVPPDPGVGPVSQPKTPEAAVPHLGLIRRIIQNRKEARAERKAARAAS